MATGFIRRYAAPPTDAELTKIEGVVIIDRDPPGVINGVGAGTVCIVGEFENGPFNEPLEMAGGGDLVATFGSFGYTYDGVVASNPCARTRLADAALVPEYWNGNGWIALANKRFARLIVVRVDTSIGEVTFTRQAWLSGVNDFTYDLEPAQTFIADIGAGNVTATFTAAVATIPSAAGVFPTTFTGGEQLVLNVEGTVYTITFLAADQTQNQAIARVNLALGYAGFVNSGGGVTTFNGRIRGTAGSIAVVSQSVLVGTALGFAVASASGTGNVANIDAVTVTEANTVISAAIPGVTIDRDADGNIRAIADTTLTIDATSTATAFGFPTGETATAAAGEDGVIPAGTRVRTGGLVEFVTMQDLAVTAGSAGPYTARIRHALDDGTGLSTGVATITSVPFPLALGAFSVTNLLPVNAALTEAQIDALYVLALDETKATDNVVRETNVIFSARQSNTLRSRLKTNAQEASDNGCFGRIAIIRPPLKTTRQQARSTTAQPGVGAYRSFGCVYAFPGAQTYVPQIALRGTAGGAGFTADGLIDTGLDSWVASLCSQLPPEENPGQATTFISGITGIEAGNPDVRGMTLDDYALFRKAGIAALRIDGGDVFIQSGVTSVDSVTYPEKTRISTRRMSYFIQDSLAVRLISFSKKLSTETRRAEILGEVNGFMQALRSTNARDLARIDDYLIDAKSKNTPESLGRGIFWIVLKVRLLPSLDFIVLDVQAGEQVVISQAA
jgi:hypothetical protein